MEFFFIFLPPTSHHHLARCLDESRHSVLSVSGFSFFGVSLLFECVPTSLQYHRACSSARACVCVCVFLQRGVTAGALCPPVTKRLRLLECDQPLSRPPAHPPPPPPPSSPPPDPRLPGYFACAHPLPLIRSPLHMGLVSHGRRSAQLEAAASWASPPFFRPSSPARPCPRSVPLRRPQPPGRRPRSSACCSDRGGRTSPRGLCQHTRKSQRGAGRMRAVTQRRCAASAASCCVLSLASAATGFLARVEMENEGSVLLRSYLGPAGRRLDLTPVSPSPL